MPIDGGGTIRAARNSASILWLTSQVATTDTVEAGEKKVYCRCWKSGTFPLCDAAHVAHNKVGGAPALP